MGAWTSDFAPWGQNRGLPSKWIASGEPGQLAGEIFPAHLCVVDAPILDEAIDTESSEIRQSTVSFAFLGFFSQSGMFPRA